jgi:hypothetical protein
MCLSIGGDVLKRKRLLGAVGLGSKHRCNPTRLTGSEPKLLEPRNKSRYPRNSANNRHVRN